MTQKLENRESLSQRLSTRLGVEEGLLTFAQGKIGEYHPANRHLYEQYRRFLHDLLCTGMVSSGYYDRESFTLSSIGLSSLDPNLNAKKPDLYSIQGNTLRICEVTFSFDPEFARNEKEKTYNKLITFIRDNYPGIVNYEILVIDLTDSEWEDQMPSVGPVYFDLIKRFVSNLLVYHSTIKGSKMRKHEVEQGKVNFPFSYNERDKLCELFKEIGVKHPESAALDNEGIGSKVIMDQHIQEQYLESISKSILTRAMPDRPFPMMCASDCADLDAGFNESFLLKKQNTSKIPVVLQLGCPVGAYEIETPNRWDLFEEVRMTKHYGGYLDLIKQSIDSKETPADGIIELHLTRNQFEQEVLQGPGRKKYMKVNQIDIKRKEPTHIGVDERHKSIVRNFLSKISNEDGQDLIDKSLEPELESVGLSLSNLITDSNQEFNRDFSAYILKFYQRISTEIILNSMKRRRSKQYVLCHSGFSGVFFLVGPGPQLRTESNVEFIKIISLGKSFVNPLCRDWIPVGDHLETDWISVDTDRLKHWARSYDRVKLSFLSSCEMLVTPDNNIREAIHSEIKYGNLALMASVYLENKCNTSTTIQTTRYFFMKSLGDRKYKGLFSKFPSRVSSVLQSFILQRCYESCKLISSKPISSWVKLPKVTRDENTGDIDETTAGVLGSVPRIFTIGGTVTVQYCINEMYWCMLYNKDRQNPTQDAMKILSKILKEERKMVKELSDRDSDQSKIDHYFGMHKIEDDIDHIHSATPESHYFSRKAVSIGLNLQDTHPENHGSNGAWLTDNKINLILNKNLSEYATFKASLKSIVRQIDRSSIDDIKKIGKRTKCIELIHEIVVNENLKTAAEVAMTFSGTSNELFEVLIQIFKKNQVGGVREIMILFIKARVLINILEEICRLMAKADKREILTKGKDKRLMMRGDYEELVSQHASNTPLMMVRNSYDMSSWCQKFIPTIFLSIFNKHSEQLGTLRDFSEFVLLSHCLKKIEYPAHLINQWCKYPDKTHSEIHLQEMKEKFLQDGKPYFTNLSNMCQGILHYMSTILALSCQSLRDELFRVCLRQLNMEQSITWKTRVGSDDKGDLICLDLTKSNSHFQARLFEKCAEASERLHSMENSVKSASGIIIYELNSAFMSNIEVLSPTIKFASAAVDMISTDSCTRFVNESYSRIRQLRENGGTSYVCAMAHCLNKEHFNNIFRTGPGMTNDPIQAFDLTDQEIPYDFGIYPMYDCDVQDMIGPDYHNYRVFNNKKTPNKILTTLYSTSVNEVSLLPEEDDLMYKKKIMSISRGMVRQLANMRSRLNLSRETIEKYLEENPFMIIRGPMTIQETAMMIGAKLYTNGAAESLRRTSPAIYLGRLSAFETAEAWNYKIITEKRLFDLEGGEHTVKTESLIKCTYKEFITKTVNSSKDVDLRQFRTLIFPQETSYQVCDSFVGRFGLTKSVRKRFAQSIRTWTLNNYNYTFSNTLRSVLETSFGLSTEASIEDVQELRKCMPFDLSSYHEFISSCAENGVRPLDAFFYISKYYNNIKTKKAQVFASGPSTVSLNLTLSSIKKYNHQAGKLVEVDVSVDETLKVSSSNKYKDNETIRLGFNLAMMMKQGTLLDKMGGSPLDMIFEGEVTLRSQLETIVRSKQNLSGSDNQTKKMYTFLASVLLTKREFKQKLLSWKTLTYTYLKRQEKNYQGVWVGDLVMIVSYASECYLFKILAGICSIEYRFIRSLRDFESSLKQLCKVLEDVDYQMLFREGHCGQYGIFLDRHLKFSSSYQRNARVLRSNQNINLEYVGISDLTEFRVENKLNKDNSMSLNLVDTQRRVLTVAHFPGNYYPVEIPKSYKFTDTLFMNGMRLHKVLKNRSWFFDQRMPDFDEVKAVEFLRHDLDTELIITHEDKNMNLVRNYIDENEEMDRQDFDEILGGDSENKVKTDFETSLQGRTFFQIFEEETNKILEEDRIDWYEEMNEASAFEFDQSDLIDQVEEMGTFIRALGENTYKTKRREFHTITNLMSNVTAINRILDLFFKGSDIQNERKELLPHYLKHVMIELEDPLISSDNRFLLTRLQSYIIKRLIITSGRSESEVLETVERLSRIRFHRLMRLDSLLSVGDIEQDVNRALFDNSDSDSEDEGNLDIYL